MTEKVKSYSPTYHKEEPLKVIAKDKLSDKFAELKKVMDKNGHMKMKLNEQVMIQRVAVELYKFPESSLRELYANACRACRLAEKLGSKNPYIKVSINTKTRKLIIHDINSQGITQKIFAQILLKLGNSSNFDPREIGLNGMGIASYPLLGDTMKIETNCIETKDNYAVLSKSGDLGFDILDETPNLGSTGTRISITLKPKINYSKLVRTLSTLASVSGVKTHLELECDRKVELGDFKAGIHQLPQTTYKDIFNSKIQDDRYHSYLTSSLVNKDIEVHLAVAVNTSGELMNSRNKEVYVINNPIECLLDEDDIDNYNDSLDEDDDDDEDDNRLSRRRRRFRGVDNDDDDDDDDVYADTDADQDESEHKDKIIYKRGKIDEIKFQYLVINLKNEREDQGGFKPKPDRERLTVEAETKIRKIVVDLFNETLKKVKPCANLKDWFDHEHKYFISSTSESVLNLIDKRSKEINAFLNLEVHKYPDKNVKTFTTTVLKDILQPEQDKFFYLLKRDKRVVNLLEQHFEGEYHCLLKLPNPNRGNTDEIYKNRLKIMHDFGFVEAKQYLKDNKIKAKREIGVVTEKEVGDIILHRAEYGDQTMSLNVNDIKLKELITAKQIVRVEPFENYRDFLKDFTNADFYITISKKENEFLPTIADLEKTISQQTYLTNLGKLTLSDIKRLKTKDKKTIKLFSDFDSSYYRYFESLPKNSVYVFDDSEVDNKVGTRRYKNNRRTRSYDINQINILKLGLVLTYNGISYDGNCEENIESFYKQKVEKFAQTIKLSPNDISDYDFDTTMDYENYLMTLKEVDTNLKDKTLRILYEKSVDKDNFNELSNTILDIQSRIGTKAKPILGNPKGQIKRPEANYFE